MRIIWKLLKVVIGLAIAIPLFIIVAVTTLGVLGTLFGLAILALKLALLGLVGYGFYRMAKFVFAPAPKAPPIAIRELPPSDRYYEAALRELDSDIG